MHFEANRRSIAKALSYRLLATLGTSLLVWWFTHKVALALFAGSADALGKLGLYYLHERIWDRVRAGKRERQPAVIWFTGLPAAGKTTIATRVAAELTARGMKVEHLDGHSIRHLFPATGFSREERNVHIKRIGHLASRLERHGVVVIASFVSPFEEARLFARSLCKSFIEVHVATPLEECERRDPKGFYARARKGEIKDFTGVDSPYEAPKNPELCLDAGVLSVEAAADVVVARVLRDGVRETVYESIRSARLTRPGPKESPAVQTGAFAGMNVEKHP
jgi:adenylylsulfate kinase